ncbi:MAG: hypothetical protein IJZ95_08065 [Oscillospiraceae bacterium]|nr:hypothetical protein [Oscillospiraceae bacterium]
MGLFDTFKKQPIISAESLNINITDNGMQINGTFIQLPCSVELLAAILGKPREVAYQPSKSQINPMLPELSAKRINYSWDALGVYCYTRSDSMVNCIGVQHKVSIKTNLTPENPFCGTLTVNGITWHEAARKGEDTEAYRRIVLGEYSAVFVYADFSNPEGIGNADDYTGTEFQLKK